MDEQRQALCYQIAVAGRGVSEVCREFGVSRKTAYKWLRAYRRDPAAVLNDRSRRPLHSPARTASATETSILLLRDKHHYGARKIHVLLERAGLTAPSIRTVTAVLGRHGRIARADEPSLQRSATCQRYEHERPNCLWQMDHKGPLEIARMRHHPLTVIDDHSRFCLCFEPLPDLTLSCAWPVLWELFAQYGLPDAILSDGAYASDRHGVSEFDQRLIRLGIRPIHGRAYHPQTQGKVERLHGTLDWELLNFNARRDCMSHFLADCDQWRRTYNLLRPHEALNDQPPISRYRRSTILRPDQLPQIEYTSGSVLRKVSQVGDIHYARVRIMLSKSLAAQFVRIEDDEAEVRVYYAWKLLRVIHHDQMRGRGHNQIT